MFIAFVCLFSSHAFAQATLPTSYAWDPATDLPTNWTASSMGSPYTTSSSSFNAPNAGKFDSSGDSLAIKFTGTPGLLTYSLKGQPASGTTVDGTFDVLESVDGTNYTSLASIVNKANAYETYTNQPAASSRFVMFQYTLKTSGNIAIDDVTLFAPTAAALPTISFSGTGGDVLENNSIRDILVNISASSAATVDVAVTGTATPGVDFTLSTTTLVFSAGGSTSQTISAFWIADEEVEPNETIELQLTGFSGAESGITTQLLFTLLDNSPAVRIESAPSRVDGTNESFTISIGKTISSGSVTGSLFLAGSATVGTDYTMSGIPFVLNGSTTSAIVQFTLNTNAFIAENKTIEVQLSNVRGAQIIDPSNTTVRIGSFDQFNIMTANLSIQPNPSYSYYEETAGRLFLGLNPDIVAVQEFVVATGSIRGYVDQYFGTNFDYHVESTADDGAALPNGIISRWPILQSGEWADTNINNRDFAWATIDIPGTQDLHVVSVHLKASAGFEDRRVAEVQDLLAYISGSFPSNDLIVLAGDLNAEDRTEPALAALTNVFSDTRQPEDQYGDRDTNSSRNKPFDYILPNRALEPLHTTTLIDGVGFRDGIVFDSTLWTIPPSPILTNDSVAPSRQHMAVMKTFSFSPPGPPPPDDVLVYYDFETDSGLFEFFPEREHPFISASNYISDDGVVNSLEGSSGRAVKETGWNNIGSYFNFTMEIADGYQTTITGLQFWGRSSGTGPTNWLLLSSLDNYATPLATGAQANDSEWKRFGQELNLSAVTGTVTFRLIAFNATSGSGSWAHDSVMVYGSVSPVGVEPPTDSNENGIPDDWENLYFGSLGISTNNNDFDLDGVTDLGEYLSGTIPTNDNSVLHVTEVNPLVNGSVLIKWDSESGKRYRVERGTSFGTAYSSIAAMVSGAPPANVVTDLPPVAADLIYYRVILQP